MKEIAMTTVPLRNALLGLLLLLVTAVAQAQVWIPLDLGDGATAWMRTGATTGLTISGNTGAAGATVSAGGVSAVSDAAGNYTLTRPAGTYTVTSSKSGCSFIPTSQSVTLGPSKTGVSFTTPCSLKLPLGATSYADNYIKNYPYGSAAGYRWQHYSRRWLASDNSGGGFCEGHQETCLTNIPYPVYSGGAGYDNTCNQCPGVRYSYNSVQYPHPRVKIGDGEPIWMDSLVGTDTAGYDYRAVGGGWLNLTDKIIVMDPIGQSTRSTQCKKDTWNNWACGDLSATLTWDAWGAAARKVYPGEITPNYWGIVPRDATAFKWQ
ncbi:MAG: hypothetical protein ABIO24_03535, partial [Saprospiraceae bacterium]